MIQKTTKEVIALIEERGAMGLAIEVLRTASAPMLKENYQQLKEKMFAIKPQTVMEAVALKQYLEQLLGYEEMMFVSFKKVKMNGKVGHKKVYEKGFCYYIGTSSLALSKVYVHWREEKKFLFANIDCLKKKEFWIEVDTIDCIPNVCCLTISLFDNEEKKSLVGEISLYAGFVS